DISWISPDALFISPDALFVSFVSGGGTPPCGRGIIRPRQARRSSPGGSVVAMSREATILIVDDEAGVREVIEEYLSGHGYTVVGAESALAARAIAAKQQVDLAVVDIHMPGEDGLSLARHLRERYSGVAIIMLTSASAVVDRVVGLEMGADDYV